MPLLQEVDTVLFFMRRRIEAYPHVFTQRCAILDMLFSVSMHNFTYKSMWLVSVSKLILLLLQGSMHARYHVHIKKDNYTHPDDKTEVPPPHDWTTSIDDTLVNYVDGTSPEYSRPWKDVDYVSCILIFIYAFSFIIVRFTDLGVNVFNFRYISQ